MAQVKNNDKAQWVKPELKHLEAGGAENGVSTRGDSNTGPGTVLS